MNRRTLSEGFSLISNPSVKLQYRRNLISLFVLAGLILPLQSFSKEVTLKWKPIKFADSYQVVVRANDKIVLSQTVDSKITTWKKELEPGNYECQIRALDLEQRPGDWSPSQKFVIEPSLAEKTSTPTLTPEPLEILSANHSR